MKHSTAWWGIVLHAEDEEDDKILQALAARLTPVPRGVVTHYSVEGDYYESGDWELARGFIPIDGWRQNPSPVPLGERLQLVFNR